MSAHDRHKNVHLFNIVSREPGTPGAIAAYRELQRRADKSVTSSARDMLQQIAEEELLRDSPGRGVNEIIGEIQDARLVTDGHIDPERIKIMAEATREIGVQTYVFDDDIAAGALIRAHDRGCCIQVNVSKGPIRRGASAEVMDLLLSSGINVDATQSIHTKILLCDRRRIMIGSANMRSTHRDAVLLLTSATLGERLHQLYFEGVGGAVKKPNRRQIDRRRGP